MEESIVFNDFVFETPLGDFIGKQPTVVQPAFVYLFYSPNVKSYKIGRTKDAKNLKLRLRERQRQCGETQILALWKVAPDKASSKEKELLDKAKPHRIGKEILKWRGDFIEFYAVFMQDADWKRYSMEVVWLPDGRTGMKGFKEETTSVDEWLVSLSQGL